MKVVVRADASTKIGSGHVMRCLTLAEELRNQGGATIAFICREHEGNLCDFITEKGFTVYRLPVASDDLENLNWNSHARWLGVPWEQDARETSEIIRQQEDGVNWLIVDHYALDMAWERQLRPLVRNIMVIDDLTDRSHDCDILLDQNLYENMGSRYTKLVPEHCRTFLGPRFALLRPEFAKARKRLRQRDGIVRRIFIFFGGSDLTNETTKALQAIQSLNRPDIALDVVIGSANPHREEIQQLCDAMEHVTLHCNVDNMAELMAKADLALGAGGATSWERCCLGLPALTISVAMNQEEIARTLAVRGGHLYLGTSDNVDVGDIRCALQTICRMAETLCMVSQYSIQLVDGNGVQRISRCIMPPHVTFRNADMNDCASVYKWRNDERTRRFIFDKQKISFEEHQKWFADSLENPDRVLLIAETERGEHGVLRFDLDETEATISVYLIPDMVNQGMGTMLIASGSRWLQQHYPRIQRISAEILPDNIASQRAFQNAGFIESHSIFIQELKHE